MARLQERITVASQACDITSLSNVFNDCSVITVTSHVTSYRQSSDARPLADSFIDRQRHRFLDKERSEGTYIKTELTYNSLSKDHNYEIVSLSKNPKSCPYNMESHTSTLKSNLKAKLRLNSELHCETAILFNAR